MLFPPKKSVIIDPSVFSMPKAKRSSTPQSYATNRVSNRRRGRNINFDMGTDSNSYVIDSQSGAYMTM